MQYKLQVLRTLISGIVLTLPLLAGCASLETSSQADAASTLKIEDPWARSQNAGENSAAYLLITSDGATGDRLTAVGTDIAGATEIHEVHDDHGVMKMRETASIDIDAGETVTLEPGGLHVMLFDLGHDLEPGDEFSLTLTFESSGEYEVTVSVRDASMQQGHGG